MHFGADQNLAVFFQCVPHFLVQEDPVFLSGLLLPDGDMLLHVTILIDVVVGQIQDIADAQGGVQAYDDNSIVAHIRFCVLIKVLEVL